jgi:hypothetical protein
MRPGSKKIAIVLFLLILSPVFGLGQSEVRREIISFEKGPGLEQELRRMDLDLLFEWEGRVYVLVGQQDLRALDKRRIPYLLESYKFPALNSPPSLLQTNINGAYHSYKELENDLQTLERAYPELAKLFTIGTTLEQRKIYALKISDHVSLDEAEAEVLFLGCHHAREWISVEVPYLLAKYLLEHYEADAEIRRAVNDSEIWIVPLVNPDGLEYTIHYYRYWRKNRRLNADGSFGIDINRNYGYNWGYDNSGSSPDPASEVYRGTGPFSEPETRAVRDFFQQREFRAMITYHSFSQLILYPWGFTKTPSDQDALFSEIAATMSALMQPVNGRVYEFGPAGAALYVTNGDATDWTFGVSGIPSFTIELPPVDELGGGFFNAEHDIDPIFNENLPAALYLIDWSIQNIGLAPDRLQNQAERGSGPDRIKTAGKRTGLKRG